MKNIAIFLMAVLIGGLFVFSCKSKTQKDKNGQSDSLVYNKVTPEWAKDAAIYEVNLRQFTLEGTINSFQKELERLNQMGVKILWFMPVNPIGEKNRKGPLGSYYAVKDYAAINPEYGTLDEFKTLVTMAHDYGMYVIIDWVANHTAWDNQLATDHPDWYKKDSAGNFVAPYDWTDVIVLDYSKPALRKYMTETMTWWVKDVGVDGFRCDVAGLVPVPFWDSVRYELDKVKPVFMLAEAEELPLMKNAFDVDYAWTLMNKMKECAAGKTTADSIAALVQKTVSNYTGYSFKMNFTSNHDENSWNGTEYEKYGDGVKTWAVLTATVPGMPLIYSGQEEPNKARLKFFERDPIRWKNYELAGFYKTLFAAKKENPALWNGSYGGSYATLESDNPKSVYSFIRVKENNKVLVILNLSDKKQSVTLAGDSFTGDYKNIFSGKIENIKQNIKITLNPWEYKFLTKNN
jgi:glycosidase